MSRGPIHRMAGIAITLTAAACSTPDGSASRSIAAPEVSSKTVAGLPVAPSSPGWQEQARTLVAANSLNPMAAARIIAALSVAQYRAVMATNDSDNDGELPAQGVGAGGRSAVEAHRGAVAGASAQVLTFFFPGAAAALEQRVLTEGDASPGGVHPQFTRGVAIGRAKGDAMIDRVKHDHFTDPWPGPIQTGLGIWVPNGPPATPMLGSTTPYLLTSGSQFRPPPPPVYLSSAYNTDLAEIKSLSVNRTTAQRDIALFWNFGPGTFTPPGYWSLTTANYIQSHGLDERGATHAFALTMASVMDALIGCWEAKYYYWMLRPSQADPTITLTYPLPNHPSYPSGHSCGSAAAGTVLTYLFPDRGQELAGWVAEAGLSRMYGGIHYRFDIIAGQNLGNSVGQLAVALDHQPGLLAAIH